MNFKKSYLQVAIAIALVGGCAYLYTSFSKEKLKEDAVEIAKDLGSKAKDRAISYGKEKIQEHKNKKGAVLSEDTVEPTIDDVVVGGAVLSDGTEETKEVITDDVIDVKRTSLVAVEHPEFISLNDLSIRQEDADKMLEMAITSLNVDEVKFLLESGVSVEFTEDKICYKNNFGHKKYNDNTTNYSQKVIPESTRDIKRNFFDFTIDKTYSTNCSKLFLYKLTPFLKAEKSDWEELGFNPKNINYLFRNYANKRYQEYTSDKGIQFDYNELNKILSRENQLGIDWYNEFYENEKHNYEKEYLKAKEIFDLLIDRIPKKDYYQFLEIIYDNEVSYEVRLKLLELYKEFYDEPVYHQNRDFFINLYKQSAIELYEETKDKDKVKKFTERLGFFDFSYQNAYEDNSLFFNLVRNLNKAGENLISYQKELDFAIRDSGDKYPDIKKVVLPITTVSQLMKGNINYKPENITDDVIKATIDYKVIGSDLNLYLANNELKLINKLKDEFNINYDTTTISFQDDMHIKGGSLLHMLVAYKSQKTTRTNAILIRYLLNNGFNPNVLNKDGVSAHSYLLQQMANHNRTYGSTDYFEEIKKSFSNKEYD